MSLLDSVTQRSIIARYSGDLVQDASHDTENTGNSGDGSDIAIEETLSDMDNSDVEARDTEMLDAEDAACKLELKQLERNYLSYSQSPFNIAALRFTTGLLPESESITYDVPLEVEILLNYLPAAAPSTKQFEF
ncbi:hypothetical protein FRC08_007122 [Ceratobasidium sp. 394]|nr:hypothetical protein FRC08_007122 [Ceratobasidium sp. 394]